MSIVVLNSQGQDPAEWENHFGRGLKLPRNAEICLCGVNLNKWEKEEGANIVQDINDAFMVAWGSVRDYLPFGSYLVSVKPGNYTASQLGSQLANALAVGNYQHDGINYLDVPISCMRLGLIMSYDAATKKMKVICNRQYVYQDTNDYDTIDKVEVAPYLGVVGTDPNSGTLVVAPLDTEVNLGLTLGIQDGVYPLFDICVEDQSYIEFNPKPNCKTSIITKALWNGSNGAGILQPSLGSLGGAPVGQILPEQELGYSWWFRSTGLERVEEVLGWRGGIFRNAKQGMVGHDNGYDIPTQSSNRENLKLDFASGGLKYDMWWQIETFQPLGGGAPVTQGTYDGSVYYMPITKINNGQAWNESNGVKVGGFRWISGDPTNTPADDKLWMVNFRPVDGKGGTDAAAPIAPSAIDATKCCIDIRVTRGVAIAPILAGATPGMIAPGNNGGTPGYVAITDGGDFDLYKGAPIYMGADNRRATNEPEETKMRIKMKGIYHDAPNANIRSMTSVNGAAGYVTAPAVIANMEDSFLSTNFAFSPLTESSDAPFIQNNLVQMSKRFSNIAATIGFREGALYTLTSANSSTGLISAYTAEGWNDKETLCVVQIPSLGIDGELGGGSGNYGGANTANILGVVGLAADNETTGGVYREPAMENWIKIKNLAHDSINQLKVKLTDTTGRKLKCLMPESTIWIKMRECRNDGGLKSGGVNPVAKPLSMMDRGYNSFY